MGGNEVGEWVGDRADGWVGSVSRSRRRCCKLPDRQKGGEAGKRAQQGCRAGRLLLLTWSSCPWA